jgi:hypothetical protein
MANTLPKRCKSTLDSMNTRVLHTDVTGIEGAVSMCTAAPFMTLPGMRGQRELITMYSRH